MANEQITVSYGPNAYQMGLAGKTVAEIFAVVQLAYNIPSGTSAMVKNADGHWSTALDGDTIAPGAHLRFEEKAGDKGASAPMGIISLREMRRRLPGVLVTACTEL